MNSRASFTFIGTRYNRTVLIMSKGPGPPFHAISMRSWQSIQRVASNTVTPNRTWHQGYETVAERKTAVRSKCSRATWRIPNRGRGSFVEAEGGFIDPSSKEIQSLTFSVGQQARPRLPEATIAATIDSLLFLFSFPRRIESSLLAGSLRDSTALSSPFSQLSSFFSYRSLRLRRPYSFVWLFERRGPPSTIFRVVRDSYSRKLEGLSRSKSPWTWKMNPTLGGCHERVYRGVLRRMTMVWLRWDDELGPKNLEI